MDRDRAYILHIKDALTAVQQFAEGISYDEFIADEKTRFAVERCLEIIGEASKRVSRETREQYKDIPWASISGMRDKIIHHYFDIDYTIVWDVIKYDAPILSQALRTID